jgi:putative transposase
VSVMCDTLAVSRGGYYAWAARPATPAAATRRAAQGRLVEQIRVAHAEEGRGLYGSPRVAAVLRAQGVAACENTVAKLMRQHGIRAAVARRFVPRTTDSTHAWRPAENVLARDFAADRPDAKWCADVTYVETDEGFLYLAAVIDLCTRRVVGWSMAPHLRATLCLDALEMAVLHRGLGGGGGHPKAGTGTGTGTGLVHHSDRGVQYCCDDYQRRLAELGVTVSMSDKGECLDNAPAESFWGTFKTELVYRQPGGGRFASHAQARAAVFEYIEVFYNRKRLHSSLGYKSPEAFEASLN